MQYLLLIYVADEKSLGPDAPAEPPMEAWMAYTRALIEAGALGGDNLIEVPDLDAALAWAARMPSMGRGPVEVRPIMPTPMPE